MSIAKFKRVVAQSPFAFRYLELMGVWKIKMLTKLPGVRELFTSVVRSELSLKWQNRRTRPDEGFRCSLVESVATVPRTKWPTTNF